VGFRKRGRTRRRPGLTIRARALVGGAVDAQPARVPGSRADMDCAILADTMKDARRGLKRGTASIGGASRGLPTPEDGDFLGRVVGAGAGRANGALPRAPSGADRVDRFHPRRPCFRGSRKIGGRKGPRGKSGFHLIATRQSAERLVGAGTDSRRRRASHLTPDGFYRQGGLFRAGSSVLWAEKWGANRRRRAGGGAGCRSTKLETRRAPAGSR